MRARRTMPSWGARMRGRPGLGRQLIDKAEQAMIGKEVPLSEINVETWKYMGCKITKEGSTIVITPPGADNPKALGSIIYYIDNLSGNTFTGRAIAKNHFGGKDNEIHYEITGTRIE